MTDVTVIEPQSVPVGLPPGGPTFEGFKWFVEHQMGVPPESIPGDDWLQIAYDQSLNLTYYMLATVPSQPNTPSIYAFAVYNLAAHFLLETAQDEPGSTFWADLRKQMGIDSFLFGLINSAADQGTSESTYILPQLQGMTLMDLQLSKSPWGRKYLMIAGQWGYVWGLTI